MNLSASPIEGARQAFLALNPRATDMDWDVWRSRAIHSEEVASCEALAAICNQCIRTLGNELDREVAYHIGYSAGHYEALRQVIAVAEAIE